MEKELDEFVTRGYRITEQGQYSTKVKEKDFGSAPVHAFTFFFVLIGAVFVIDAAGLPDATPWVVAFGANAIYLAYSWLSAEEVVIMVDQETEEAEQSDSVDASTQPTQ